MWARSLELGLELIRCVSLLFSISFSSPFYRAVDWSSTMCNVHHWKAFHYCICLLRIVHFTFINDNFLKLQQIVHSITIIFIGMKKFSIRDNLTCRVICLFHCTPFILHSPLHSWSYDGSSSEWICKRFFFFFLLMNENSKVDYRQLLSFIHLLD